MLTYCFLFFKCLQNQSLHVPLIHKVQVFLMRFHSQPYQKLSEDQWTPHTKTVHYQGNYKFFQLDSKKYSVKYTVTSCNSTRPFKFHQADFLQQAGLDNDKLCILQTET